MLACDVERALPKHFHQTFGSPLRLECALGEQLELQDCLNREVWGPPTKILSGMIIIGLMWVYAIKGDLITGFFLRIRSRITLMGNQERNIPRRLEAYAPVAQMVTNRLLIATHLHIPGILFRKLDVKNAYINENMKRKVWCRVPPGY